MSLCPTPAVKLKTDYTTPGALIITPPDALFEICGGSTTSIITDPGTIVTQTICCPSPGPQGPIGPPGELELLYDGSSLGTVGSLDIKGTGLTASVAGNVGTITTIALVWKGDWSASTAYKKYEVVRNANNGNAYVCLDNHTSTTDDEPGETTGGDFYWDPVTDVNKAQMQPEDKDFLDQLKENVFDWWDNATIGDRLLGIVAAAGVVYAGAKVLEMLVGDGIGDGQADSRYDGTPGYNGAYTPPTLPVVVSSIMEFAGYTSLDYDVSLLPSDQVNITIADTVNLRAILQQLALVYQFDIVPSEGKVKFVPKYQPAVRTLSIEDMGHESSSGDPVSGKAPYTARRRLGIDLPRRVTVKYYSANLDYNPFTQVSTLETYEEGQDAVLEVPLTLLDEDAKRVAELALINSHIEQQEFTFTTDYYNIDLEPGDVVNVPLDSGGTVAVRITQINETDDGVLEFVTVRADNNITSYNVSPIPQASPPDQTTNIPSTLGYSQTLFLEVPPLPGEGQPTQPRLKTIVHGYGASGWPGAAIYRSVDGGVSYTPVLTSSSMNTIGVVSSPTLNSNGKYHIWDDDSIITVVLKQGTLTSSTDIAVQNGQNWCMVGEEVIGFVNATLVGTNTYQLTRLLRGRAGSEQKCLTHVNDELFVLLDNTLATLPLTSPDLGQTVKYKTVTLGSDLSKVSADDVMPYGLNMRPWAVAQLKAVRQGDDWIISWVERPRFNNHLQDYQEINHDSDWAGFGITITQGVDVKHSAMTVEDTYTYTAAQQVADFGSVQTSLTLTVTQLSTIVGGGYPTTITV